MRITAHIDNPAVLRLIQERSPADLLKGQDRQLEVLRPFTESDVAEIQAGTDDTEARVLVANECEALNERFVHGYDDTELVTWVNTAVLHRDLAPLLMRATPDALGDVLHSFYMRSPPEFAIALSFALERIARAELDHWRNLSVDRLLTALDIVDLFALVRLAPAILALITSRDLTGQDAPIRLEAVRVLAGFEDESVEHHLLALIETAEFAAPCYEALSFMKSRNTEQLFWPAALAAARSGDSALAAVCSVLALTPGPERLNIIDNVFRLAPSPQDSRIVSVIAHVMSALARHGVGIHIKPCGWYAALPGLQNDANVLIFTDVRYPTAGQHRIRMSEVAIGVAVALTHDASAMANASIRETVPEEEFTLAELRPEN